MFCLVFKIYPGLQVLVRLKASKDKVAYLQRASIYTCVLTGVVAAQVPSGSSTGLKQHSGRLSSGVCVCRCVPCVRIITRNSLVNDQWSLCALPLPKQQEGQH